MTSRSGASSSRKPASRWSNSRAGELGRRMNQNNYYPGPELPDAKKRSRPGGRLLGVEPPSREGEGMAQGDPIVEEPAPRVCRASRAFAVVVWLRCWK